MRPQTIDDAVREAIDWLDARIASNAPPITEAPANMAELPASIQAAIQTLLEGYSYTKLRSSLAFVAELSESKSLDPGPITH